MSGKGAKGLSGKGLSGKGAKGTKSSKKGDKRKPTSRSVKAGLQFPVGRIHRFLKVCFFFDGAVARRPRSGRRHGFEALPLGARFDRLNLNALTRVRFPRVIRVYVLTDRR